MHPVRAIIKLARLDSCLLASLAVFLPVLSRTKDVATSVALATPVLFIAVCTYIANDLDDIESDRINHPERPLPSKALSPAFAVSIYFVCLALALFTTRGLVHASAAFWYYLLLTLSISYGYVVEWFPSLKAPYVAGALTIPIVIVAALYPTEPILPRVTVSLFFLSLGRELCKDVADRAGDKPSFMHDIDSGSVAAVAFCIQAAGLLFLLPHAVNSIRIASLLAMTSMLAMAAHYWFTLLSRGTAIVLMKVQLFLGLIYLI